MKDYYIGESAPNSSYDNNVDDMSLNIILPKTIVKKRMKDSVDSTELVVIGDRRSLCEGILPSVQFGKPFESKKYTVTELAELYKPSVQRTVSLRTGTEGPLLQLISPEDYSANNNNLPANININTLSECITHDSMDDLRISSKKTSPVTNEPQSPTKFDQGVVCIHQLIRTVSLLSETLSKRETKNASDTSGQPLPVASGKGQTRPATMSPTELVVKEAFSPPCQNATELLTSKGASGQRAGRLRKGTEGPLLQLTSKVAEPPEKFGQTEVSTYVKIHWYNKLNFTFIGPILDKYRKHKITPEI